MMKAFSYIGMALATLYFFAACTKEYSFERGPAGSIAIGSLRSVSGDCQPVTISGVYKQDSLVGNDNYVIVQVHFTSPGRYKIFTDTQNGFSFQDSALVVDTGYQSIKLKARGKPILAQTTNFSVAFDTSFCMFSVPVVGITNSGTGGAINASESAWEFTEGNNSFHGYFDGALTYDTSGSTILTLVGLTSPTKDKAIAISVYIAGSSSVKPGTYKSSGLSYFVFFDRAGNFIYTADKYTSGAEMTIVVTKYDAATRIVEGTFSGTAFNQANQQVSITGGKFKAQLN
ncbi:MAG: hypothetical protein ICV79_08685 [Flavisolibacter sp.]|nr:hypothetical protein [Flavisolibacter sp.]